MSSNKNKKLLASLGFGACALTLVGFGTFAFFTNNDTQDLTATAGTVDVKLENGTLLTNAGNINPGDNDPATNTDKDRRPGTDHKLSFTVNNEGNKSLKTRNVLTIKMADDKSKLNPNVFFFTKNNVELVAKYYTMEDGSDIPVAEYDGTSTIKAVKYIVDAQVLDGKGDPLSADGTRGEAEVENAVQTTSANYEYTFGMSSKATDEYQGQNISIKIDVQAMQYRNTKDSDWKTLFSDGLSVMIP